MALSHSLLGSFKTVSCLGSTQTEWIMRARSGAGPGAYVRSSQMILVHSVGISRQEMSAVLRRPGVRGAGAEPAHLFSWTGSPRTGSRAATARTILTALAVCGWSPCCFLEGVISFCSQEILLLFTSNPLSSFKCVWNRLLANALGVRDWNSTYILS